MLILACKIIFNSQRVNPNMNYVIRC